MRGCRSGLVSDLMGMEVWVWADGGGGIVHARGAAAHGYFESYEDWSNITAASFLGKKGKQTPVFTRFSTVAGSRGSADSVRDVRGFAVRFYTDAGNYGLHFPVPESRQLSNIMGRRYCGEQYSRLLHPRRDPIPRPHPQRQTATRLRNPPSRHRTRQCLGLLLPESLNDAHPHVGTLRPRDLPLVQTHGRLRGAHLPLRQR